MKIPQQPCYRSIIAVDAQASTMRTNQAKSRLRDTMYQVCEEAFLAASVTEQRRDPFFDRGDGVLTLVHPADEVPKTLLLGQVAPTLSRLLARDHDGLRMRMVMHAGEVHYDEHGCYSDALDLAFRLLDAPETKAALRATPAPLVLVVSDHIYQSVVRHGYPGIDRDAYEPSVATAVGDRRELGWIHIPRAASGVPVDRAGLNLVQA
ncbi:hypothetical protein JOF56_007711 [Kibdelosporangium banguiense]|uniref:Uncharacterized protein n=1 Tax=Kibdelosporangium banguiense TaxID=1365924 RepID=A0ABS4TTS1_9PSEU|nr:hypothetical protein [Kibdelosporangium banguiense]MBP2327326.1 hypothetical protein [Kibdelosporangium banguiense]